MSTAPEHVGDREHRLGEAICSCLEAEEEGRNPRELIARYPEFAAELDRFFADREQLSGLTSALRSPRPGVGRPRGSPHPDGLDRMPASFGDYELLEKLGQGGMGVVYKARQKSLNRLVALKTVRADVLDSEAEVRRFRNEAETVAHLDHPNIVPIYEVGEREGQQFFSMKLVEGGSLAQRILDVGLPVVEGRSGKDDQGRVWPSAHLRSRQCQVAKLLATVARTVHYAHQCGILHRDLKPANILLDAQGQPHVTDFGLAKRVVGLGGAAAESVSESGAIVGTPTYMAPEQASGQKRALTTAADVYSLGAILYELLTGRPPFRGENRLDTLLQIRDREAVRPRASNPQTDPGLEVICLKCLEKDQRQRYPSALALAEDLERWLAGEPLLARPAGNLERLGRWCRRKPLVAGLTAGLVVALALGVAGITWQWRQAERHRRAAEENLAEARRQRTRAEVSFRQAHKAVDDFCTKLSQKLKDVPGSQAVRKELLEAALRYYEEFLEQDRDPALQAELASAHLQIGLITQMIGSRPEGLAIYEKTRELFEKLVRLYPNYASFQDQLAWTYLSIGTVQHELGQSARALASFRQARAVHDQLVLTHPLALEYQRGLGVSNQQLGVLLAATGQADEALACLSRSCGLLEELLRVRRKDPQVQSDLAASYHGRGGVLRLLGRAAEARRWYEQAFALREQLYRSGPGVPQVQADLAASYRSLGRLDAETGRPAAARQALEKARELCEQAARTNPTVTGFRNDLAATYRELGTIQQEAGQSEAAVRSYEQARAVVRELIEQHAHIPDFARTLAQVDYRVGTLYRDTGRPGEALPLFTSARTFQEEIVSTDPDHLEDRSELALIWRALGGVLEELGRRDEALDAYRQAVAVQRQACTRAPGVLAYGVSLSASYDDLVRLLRHLGRSSEAAAVSQEQSLPHVPLKK